MDKNSAVTVLIADDEPLARERLAHLLEGLDGYRLLHPFACNGNEALELALRLQPDVLLLDIRMPGLDGLQVAQQLCEREQAPAVIFCTAFDAFALEAFKVSAAGYLVKPVREEHLAAALKTVRRLNRAQLAALATAQATSLSEKTGSARSHISVQSHRGLELIALSSVLCFIADQKYVTLRHEGGEALLDEPLKALEDELGERFVRIHRNALVSRERIERLQRGALGQFQLHLRGLNEPLAVSRRHVAELRGLMKTL